MLGPDELPLVLLAAVGHSDVSVRQRFAERLDAAIEAARPMHSVKELRDFFGRQHGTRRRRFALSPSGRDVAVRTLRLIFAEGQPRHNADWVRIACGTTTDNADGFLINADLKPRYLNRIVHTEHRRKQLAWQAQVLAGRAAARLAQFHDRVPLVRATYRLEDGFCLDVKGELPWRTSDGLLALSTLGGIPLVKLELKADLSENGLRVRTTSAEAMIRFSAALARGDRLVLRCAGSRHQRQLIVKLREIEDDIGEMPVVVSYAGGEPWVRNVPCPALTLTEADRLALSRWAYPLGAWLDEKMLEKLL